MMMKNIILGILLLCTITLNAKTVNVADLDIAGIKLGMSPDEVMDKIVETYKIEKKKLNVGENRSEGVEYIAEISYRSKQMNIRVQFCCTREGKDNSPLVVVDSVNYGVPSTVENVKSMREMALSKYGKPSKQNENDIYWCEHLDKYYCELFTPSLHLTGTNIYLKDESYSKRLTEFLRKKKIVKPKF